MEEKKREPILINPIGRRSFRTPMPYWEFQERLKAGEKFTYYDIGLNPLFEEMTQGNFLVNPVITGDFKPKFYWTGNAFEDAKRINNPHIKKEGHKEDRIKETIDLLSDLQGFDDFNINDMFNIQNELLKHNNWRGVKSGFREHNVTFNGTPDFPKVQELTERMFPVSVMNEASLLEWYRQIQMIHPLSDLNGRVFGIIISILNDVRISRKID